MARPGIESLDEHPNATEINGIVGRLPYVPDTALQPLAAAWKNTHAVASARDQALRPDSPLVCEVLAVFDAVQELWADDLAGRTPLVPDVVSTALKAIRDAVAAAYARPTISRGNHRLLLQPWRTVFPTDGSEEPDLGRRGAEINRVMRTLPWLATRCHDAAAARRYEELSQLAWWGLEERSDARREAWSAAVITGRRRTWRLVRRSGADALARPCPACHRRPEADSDLSRVATLCVDVACGLLVADAIPIQVLDVLTTPIHLLIPEQRPASY
jgi:hypothetical protein